MALKSVRRIASLNSNIVQFPWRPKKLDHQESRPAAEHVLAVPALERTDRASELRLEDPELLLCVCEILRSQLETAPLIVHDEALFFYRFIEKPDRPIGVHDERDYFLGEFALTVGTAGRFLFKIEEAKSWLQRAEANFALAQNANAHWARVAYQRLVLAGEERHFDEVLDLAPLWAGSFIRLGMPEDAIKCRFLEGAVRWELGEAEMAIAIHEGILADATGIGSTRLIAQAASNLARYVGTLGRTDEALAYARRALPLLKQLGSQVHLVKLRWSVGEMLRTQGKRAGALDAYRQAQADANELGMRGDLAALHLVIADLLLEAGQEAQAEWEIRAALPIIDPLCQHE